MTALYKKEGYSAFSACLPTLLSIIIFFVVINGFNKYSNYNNKEIFNNMTASYNQTMYDLDESYILKDADGNAVYSGTARCGANFILFSSADVVADSAYTLKAGDSSTEGTAQSGTVSTGMGVGGGFPGGGQKPDGELPEGFDGQMPNGENPELPDGEVPEMPSGERPTPPSGQGSPADGNAPAGDSTSDTTPTA